MLINIFKCWIGFTPKKWWMTVKDRCISYLLFHSLTSWFQVTHNWIFPKKKTLTYFVLNLKLLEARTQMSTSMIWHAQRTHVWINYRYVISLLCLPHLKLFCSTISMRPIMCTPEGTWFSSNWSCLESWGEFSGLIWFRWHSYCMEAIEN